MANGQSERTLRAAPDVFTVCVEHGHEWWCDLHAERRKLLVGQRRLQRNETKILVSLMAQHESHEFRAQTTFAVVVECWLRTHTSQFRSSWPRNRVQLPSTFRSIRRSIAGMPLDKELNIKKTCDLLGRIMEFELAGVVRYTHYSLMVAGPNRIPIVAFMKAQANESLLHAQQAGEILTGLGGHPSMQIADIEESNSHGMKDILDESLDHERHALSIYKELLAEVENRSVYLEEFARTQIGQEELHGLELRKMLRDIGVDSEGLYAPAKKKPSPKKRK